MYFCSLKMSNGVTVALQFLVLSVLVRIQVGQQSKKLSLALSGSFYFITNEQTTTNKSNKNGRTLKFD